MFLPHTNTLQTHLAQSYADYELIDIKLSVSYNLRGTIESWQDSIPSCCQILNARLAYHPAHGICPHMECSHSGFIQPQLIFPRPQIQCAGRTPQIPGPSRWSSHCLDQELSKKGDCLFVQSCFSHPPACLGICFYSSPLRRPFLSNQSEQSYLYTAFQEVTKHCAFAISMASGKH